ncbi:MAG: Tn3 family transposase, partial [Casimicrobium sp.]
IAHDRGRRPNELHAISGAHALLTNVVIAWNTLKMQSVVDRWRRDHIPVEEHWLQRMGPVHFGHINFRGLMSFAIKEYAEVLLQPSATPNVSKLGRAK